MGTIAPFSVTLYDPLVDKITLVGDDAGRIQAENPAPALGGAVALDTTATRGLYFIAQDGSYARVYTPPAGRATFDVAADEAQGSAFAWLEGALAGLDYADIALYTEPYTTTSAGSQPKRLTTVDTLFNYGAGMVVNAGMALVLTTPTTAELVRLSDGWGWSIPAETGDRWAKPLWVSASEVWIAVADAQTTLGNGLVKFQLADLGPPTIAPH